MRTLIIEDEELAVHVLQKEINENCPSLQVIGVAGTIKEGIAQIKTLQPDLLFLDIQLSDGLSFEILEAFPNPDFKVIFTTAYSHYAIKAIKCSAIDYLLKPIEASLLIEAVQKTIDLSIKEQQLKLSTLISNQKTTVTRRKIALQSTEGISIYEIDAILKCSADGSYTKLTFTNGKKILFSKPLKEFEELLSENGFERIHHSHIINLNHITQFVNKDGGYVVLSDQSTLPVSQRKKKQLIEALKNFNF
ncbi:MAG: LytR/AlgR family response regulator transcription factor [Flavobacteriaceae bacterium]